MVTSDRSGHYRNAGFVFLWKMHPKSYEPNMKHNKSTKLWAYSFDNFYNTNAPRQTPKTQTLDLSWVSWIFYRKSFALKGMLWRSATSYNAYTCMCHPLAEVQSILNTLFTNTYPTRTRARDSASDET